MAYCISLEAFVFWFQRKRVFSGVETKLSTICYKYTLSYILCGNYKVKIIKTINS